MEDKKNHLKSIQKLYQITRKDIEILEAMINANRVLTPEEVAGINNDNIGFRQIVEFYSDGDETKQPNLLEFKHGKELMDNIHRIDALIKLYNKYTLGPKLKVLIE